MLRADVAFQFAGRECCCAGHAFTALDMVLGGRTQRLVASQIRLHDCVAHHVTGSAQHLCDRWQAHQAPLCVAFLLRSSLSCLLCGMFQPEYALRTKANPCGCSLPCLHIDVKNGMLCRWQC